MIPFRKGDKISLSGIVALDQRDNERVFIDVDGHHAQLWLFPREIKLVQHAICVGDTVTWAANQTQYTGTVLAIAVDHAWIERDGNKFSTVYLSNLTRTKHAEET